MTHDLLKSFLDKLDIAIEKIVVNDVRNNTFFAMIHCRRAEQAIVIDSRPSDAIALALRMSSPIFVEDEVVKKAQRAQVRREGRVLGEAAIVAREPPARRFRQVQDVGRLGPGPQEPDHPAESEYQARSPGAEEGRQDPGDRPGRGRARTSPNRPWRSRRPGRCRRGGPFSPCAVRTERPAGP
ncbi:MAG: bifunctional nuclease family protein [Candidatus Moduliflexus flocculans]|nr:bifunctional nuclease family protein [Candidatus Moduliflexus flocculans]